MQNELKTRLAQRRKDGLTYDLTSEESDVIEDDDGGDDDDGKLQVIEDDECKLQVIEDDDGGESTVHVQSQVFYNISSPNKLL